MTKQSATAKNSRLKVTVYWGDVLYDIALLETNQSITVGRDATNTYVLDFDDGKKMPAFELVRADADSAELKFDDTIKGHVKIKGSMVSLSNARTKSLIPKDSDGVYRFQLQKSDKADLAIGLVSFYFDWTDKLEILPRTPFLKNRRLIPIYLVSATLLLLGLWLLQNLTPPLEEKPPERVVSLISHREFAKAAVGEKKSATGGAATGELGKAELRPNSPPSEVAKLKSANLGSLVSNLTAIGSSSPKINGAGVKSATSVIEQTGTGGFSTEGLKQGGGGKASGLGRTVGQGEGGFEGTGRLGLSGNAARESGTGFGQDVKGSQESGLDRDVIDSIIRRRQSRIRLCYERQLNFNPKLAGKVNLHFVIGKAGEVVSSKILEDTMRNQSVNSCILSEISSWKFPAPRGGVNVVVDYPFFFESSSKEAARPN